MHRRYWVDGKRNLVKIDNRFSNNSVNTQHFLKDFISYYDLRASWINIYLMSYLIEVHKTRR